MSGQKTLGPPKGIDVLPMISLKKQICLLSSTRVEVRLGSTGESKETWPSAAVFSISAAQNSCFEKSPRKILGEGGDVFLMAFYLKKNTRDVYFHGH